MHKYAETVSEVKNGMRRIGLMGGSFNPIHLAHVNLARAALEGGHVDEVLFLPTGNPPHKREGLVDKEDRYAMTCLAIAGEQNMRASRVEIDREGMIYTVDTVGLLRKQMPDCAFTYLIGADTVFQLHTWKRIDTLITLCTFLVCMRPGEDAQAAREEAQRWRERGADIRFMDAELMAVSSTEVRERLCKGLAADDLLPPAVAAYIREHGLYRAKAPGDET